MMDLQEKSPDGNLSSAEDTKLQNMGYEPELKRSFGLLGMIGFSFSIVTWYVENAWEL